MDADLMPAGSGDAEWVATQRRWTQGWRRLVIPGMFLVYLAFVVPSVTENSRGAARVAGYLILAAFAACYLLLVLQGEHVSRRRLWALCGVFVALFLAELPLARDAAFVMCLYLTAVSVGLLGVRSVPIILGMALAALLVPALIPSWHDTVGSDWSSVTPIAILVVALASFGFMRVLEGNRALAEARSELARLTAENERFRIARDLHDLLGHSLTTITVKAGLASRLGDTDPIRSRAEIAEVESLARQALADVRAAVAGYRDVTLAGELASGREVLRAAGITAELPSAVDVVDSDHQELFGWVVREGLTNVVRHSHASSCAVRLSARSIEIVDDGVGVGGVEGNGHTGTGLAGLRERVAAIGGAIEAGPLTPRGWRVRVSVAPDGGAR